MRPKVPPHDHAPQKNDKEKRIERFIRQHLERTGGKESEALLMVARCCSSPVARALTAAAEAIGARPIVARVVLAAEDCGLEEWLAACPAGVSVEEIRIARNPQLHDAHEQLVLGTTCVWFGDSLRRDPAKRDTYEEYRAGDLAGARRARATFERLWRATEPLFAQAQASLAAAAGDAPHKPHRGTLRA
jgi:hypothetical protein